MKKSITFFMLFLCTCFIAVANDDAFTEHLKDCSSYSSSGTVNTEGVQAHSTKRILGWQNGKCSYEERINLMGLNSIVSCELSRPQINEIVSVTNAYSVVSKYSDSPDTSNLDSAKSNPVSQVWLKYLNNPSVCNISVEGMNN